jgi:hypothetical protein
VKFDKDKILEKWSTLFESQKNFNGPIPDSGSTPSQPIDWNTFSFPIARKIEAITLAGGGWTKSKKQELKETRINKLRKIKGEKPNIVLPNDQFINGLVSVQPLSMPTGQFFYMDYKYGPTLKQQRKAKLIRILRKEKMEYIDEFIRNGKI